MHPKDIFKTNMLMRLESAYSRIRHWGVLYVLTQLQSPAAALCQAFPIMPRFKKWRRGYTLGSTSVNRLVPCVECPEIVISRVIRLIAQYLVTFQIVWLRATCTCTIWKNPLLFSFFPHQKAKKSDKGFKFKQPYYATHLKNRDVIYMCIKR